MDLEAWYRQSGCAVSQLKETEEDGAMIKKIMQVVSISANNDNCYRRA